MATQNYNFKIALKGLDNEATVNEKNEPILLSELLCANIMTASIKENILKFFDWGLELRKTGILTLDNTDKQVLSNFILASERLTILGKGRLIEVLNVPVGA